MPRPTRTRAADRGAALIALIVAIVLAIAWLLVATLNARVQRTALERNDNADVLAQAKAALIGWMATNAADSGGRNPGRLPCPEAPGFIGTSNEGIAAGGCSDPAIGRLPWRTLGLPELRDASGEPLWYVVSPGWALPGGSATLTINSDTPGALTLDGRANAAVALIIAPGPALEISPDAAQGAAGCAARTQRRGTTPPDPADYIECARLASAPYAFWSAAPDNNANPVQNDQVLAIMSTEIAPQLEAAVAERAQRDLAPLVAAAALQMPGATSGHPVYPFATAWGDPSASAYNGTVGTSWGLLPVARSRKACSLNPADPTFDPACDSALLSVACNPAPGGDPQCDPSTAVTWPLDASIPDYKETKNPGQEWTVTWKNANAGNDYSVVFAVAPGYPSTYRIDQVDRCANGNSTPVQISCRVTYGRKCSGGCAGPPWIELVVTASTSTSAGRAFRRVNLTSALLGSMFYGISPRNSVTPQSDGSANVTTDWLLWIPPGCVEADCTRARIVLPALVVEDNVVFQSRLRDAPPSSPDLRWFLANNWQQLSYYAVAPTDVWGAGASPCSGSGCLSVAGVPTAYAFQQSLLVIAGRALAGKSHPSANLADYFEGANAVEDKSFVARVVNQGFNDRVVLVDPVP